MTTWQKEKHLLISFCVFSCRFAKLLRKKAFSNALKGKTGGEQKKKLNHKIPLVAFHDRGTATKTSNTSDSSKTNYEDYFFSDMVFQTR